MCGHLICDVTTQQSTAVNHASTSGVNTMTTQEAKKMTTLNTTKNPDVTTKPHQSTVQNSLKTTSKPVTKGVTTQKPVTTKKPISTDKPKQTTQSPSKPVTTTGTPKKSVTGVTTNKPKMTTLVTTPHPQNITKSPVNGTKDDNDGDGKSSGIALGFLFGILAVLIIPAAIFIASRLRK